jgi:hypothetical protein
VLFFSCQGAAGGGSRAYSSSSPDSAIGQAEVVIVELEPPAFLAAIQVEGFDLFTEVCELPKEEVPWGTRAAYADRKLAQAAEGYFAVRAVGGARVIH